MAISKDELHIYLERRRYFHLCFTTYLPLQEAELKLLLDKQAKEIEVWIVTCLVSVILCWSRFLSLCLNLGPPNHPLCTSGRVRDFYGLCFASFEVARAGWMQHRWIWIHNNRNLSLSFVTKSIGTPWSMCKTICDWILTWRRRWTSNWIS